MKLERTEEAILEQSIACHVHLGEQDVPRKIWPNTLKSGTEGYIKIIRKSTLILLKLPFSAKNTHYILYGKF